MELGVRIAFRPFDLDGPQRAIPIAEQVVGSLNIIATFESCLRVNQSIQADSIFTYQWPAIVLNC